MATENKVVAFFLEELRAAHQTLEGTIIGVTHEKAHRHPPGIAHPVGATSTADSRFWLTPKCLESTTYSVCSGSLGTENTWTSWFWKIADRNGGNIGGARPTRNSGNFPERRRSPKRMSPRQSFFPFERNPQRQKSSPRRASIGAFPAFSAFSCLLTIPQIADK
jgi:hypothetical protein